MNDQNSVLFYQLLGHIEFGRNVEAKSMLNEELALASDEDGTLLHQAAAHNNSVIARELIGLGADVDQMDDENQTPLMLALKNGNHSVVEVLLEANADINICNVDGESALLMALNWSNFNEDIVQTFVRILKTKIPTTEELAETLIAAGGNMHHAANFQDFDVMKYMLERGIDINSCYDGEMTALHAAAELGDSDVVEWLTDNGADINAVDKGGDTALLLAATVGHKDVVKILLEKGADPNCSNRIHLCTPLHVVFRNNSRGESDEGFFECAKLLLQYGAALSGYCTYNESTIFDYALEWPTDRGVKLLISHVAVPELLDAPIANLAKYCNREENPLKMPEFANFYEQCLRVLKIAILEQVSLFDLFKVGGYGMRLLARDQTFVSKIKGIDFESEHGELHAFYLKKVIKRIDYASDMVKLEDEAIPVICRMFNSNYNLCYAFARKIIGYLNERDFQQLLQV